MKTLAQVIFERLEKEGVDCTFGIPGDFILPMYAAQLEYGMKSIVCTHEPSAAFAADAYARLKGFGVALTTFGTGGLIPWVGTSFENLLREMDSRRGVNGICVDFPVPEPGNWYPAEQLTDESGFLVDDINDLYPPPLRIEAR